MLDFILCPSCGNPIGAVYAAFRIIKTERYKKLLEARKMKIDVRNINVVDDIELNMEDVFTDLHINNICCRQRMTTNVTFVDARY